MRKPDARSQISRLVVHVVRFVVRVPWSVAMCGYPSPSIPLAPLSISSSCSSRGDTLRIDAAAARQRPQALQHRRGDEHHVDRAAAGILTS